MYILTALLVVEVVLCSFTSTGGEYRLRNFLQKGQTRTGRKEDLWLNLRYGMVVPGKWVAANRLMRWSLWCGYTGDSFGQMTKWNSCHSGYIWKIFLQYGFAGVCSGYPSDWNYCHNIYSGSVFLQRGYAGVSSGYLCHWNSCHNIYKNLFSPVWVRWCLFRWDDWMKLSSQCLHLKGFSPVWVWWCLFRSPAWLKLMSQYLQ